MQRWLGWQGSLSKKQTACAGEKIINFKHFPRRNGYVPLQEGYVLTSFATIIESQNIHCATLLL